MEAVVFNGCVYTIDRARGKKIRPHLLARISSFERRLVTTIAEDGAVVAPVRRVVTPLEVTNGAPQAAIRRLATG